MSSTTPDETNAPAAPVIQSKDLAPVADAAFEQLVSYSHKVKITLENVLDVLVRAMEIAEGLVDIDRKSWVIAAVIRAVETNPLLRPAETRAIINFLTIQAPALIEVIIKATKGALQVNQAVEEVAAGCGSCFAFCKTK